MKNNYIIISIWLFTLISIDVSAQNNNCGLETIHNENITVVETKDVICLAQNSSKNKIFLYSFGMWCAPCIAHLPNAIKLSEEYDLEMFVLLIDKEDESILLDKTIKYLKEKKNDIKILILKDYKSKKRTAKYVRFLKEITPEKFENLNDMSKYIILNKKGEVILVTTWKDNRNNDWRDDSKMIEKTIIPILRNN